MGPRNPLAGGEVETVETWADGSKIVCQPFKDGDVYQIVSPRGTSSVLLGLDLRRFVPDGHLLSVHNPHDVGDEHDQALYITVWVPKEEKEEAKAA